jgi:hypothetical protein
MLSSMQLNGFGGINCKMGFSLKKDLGSKFLIPLLLPSSKEAISLKIKKKIKLLILLEVIRPKVVKGFFFSVISSTNDQLFSENRHLSL